MPDLARPEPNGATLAPIPLRLVLGMSLCFFLSGAGSLVLEVVWTRLLRLVFGSTTLAVSTTLVAYMAGLGLGGLVAGRLAGRLRNGVRAYALLELMIASYALAVPWLLELFPALGRAFLYQLPFWPAALVRFALALAVLALPTFLMGATLPLVVSALARERALAGRRIALLYGVNTLGAVAGVLLTTFVLFGSFGVWGANAAGAGIDALVGLFALGVLARHFGQSGPQQPAEPSPQSEPHSGARLTPAVVAYGLVGFTALVYEVAWTRSLAMVLGSSIYAFAAMLAAFLLGIALGSVAARTFVDRLVRPLYVFALGITLLGLLSLGTMLLLPRLPDVFAQLLPEGSISGGQLVAIHFGLSMLAMLPPALVLGALFPLLARALAERPGGAARAVGEVYFANTVGSACGAFLAGFVLIPTLGLQGSMSLATSLNFATAALLVCASTTAARSARGAAALAAALGIAWLWLASPAWDPRNLLIGVYLPGHARELLESPPPLEGVPAEQILYYRDGLNTTVSVHDYLGTRSLHVNGKPDASTGRDMPTQVLSGQIPLLFGPAARDVLVIGWASGVTVGSVARHPVASITAIEIEPAILEASHYFDEQSGRPIDDPRVRVVADDGRIWLANTREKFDVIISEPSNPWITGASNLFTREYLQAARAALRPRGRLLQWVQLYGMDPATLRSLLATVRSVFPHVYGFAHSAGSPDLLLLASLDPLGPQDLPRWSGLSEDVRADLVRVGNFGTDDLWSLMRLAPGDIAAFSGDNAVINTDANLFVELRSPFSLYRDTLSSNWRALSGFDQGIGALLDDGASATPAELAGVANAYVDRRGNTAIARALAVEVERRGARASAGAVRARIAQEDDSLEAEARLALLDAALAERPELDWARMTRAQLHLATGQLDRALADVERVILERPDDPRGVGLRGMILLRLDRAAEAAVDLDELLATRYGRSERAHWAHAEATRAHFRSGQLAEGIRHLEELLAKDPYSVPSWRLLAEARAADGRTDAAASARRNGDRLESYALVVQSEALPPGEARTHLERALELDPDSRRAREHLESLPHSPDVP